MTRSEYHKEKKKELRKLENPENRVFHIAVCGKFNVGKTSLLNLLLGLDLPVKAVTATGVITKIGYGAPMEVMFGDGSCKRVSKDKLKRYITVAGKDLGGVHGTNAVSVSVPCQSELMAGGAVEFWDTPGLEDDERLNRITLDAVKQCDMAVMVMDAAKILSQGEKFLLYRLQEMLGGNVLVVINRWDMLREDEKTGVKHTAEVFLKNFGNDCCGYGQFILASARPDAGCIDNLYRRLYDICMDQEKRMEMIRYARSARVKSFAREWDEELERDIGELKGYTLSCSRKFSEIQDKKRNDLRKAFLQKKKQVKNRLTQVLYQVDERAYWANALETVKNTDGWDGKYVQLSADVMKQSMQGIFDQARRVAGEELDIYEYPECYPLPELSEGDIWEEMDWGQNCVANNAGGMVAGAIAGAAAGSAVFGVGAIIGAGIGLFLGACRDSSKDGQERQAFQNSCIDRTLSAFYKEPSMNIKSEIQSYMDGLLHKMEMSWERKKAEIEKETILIDDESYNEALILLDELSEYRKRIGRYIV